MESAYRAQFLGMYRRYKTNSTWKANVENKYKLFAWILIQNKTRQLILSFEAGHVTMLEHYAMAH
jgi:hypothetical protein